MRLQQSTFLRRLRCRSTGRSQGFAIAPILYLLGLIGVGAGVLFSGYSQILRSNQTMSNTLAAKNDLQGSATTLAASSWLSTDQTLLCPPLISGSNNPSTPAVKCSSSISAITVGSPLGGANLPANAASVSSAGSPVQVGVFNAGAGVKVLDPWGHYYLYCRWENSIGTASAIMIITAGANGRLESNCGSTTAGGDDLFVMWTTAVTQNRAAVWQTTTTGSQVTGAQFGAVGSQITVDTSGNVDIPGTLQVVGTSTFGSISGVNGYFSGPVTGSSGTFTGTVSGGNGSFTTLDVGSGSQFTVDSSGNANTTGTLGVSGLSTLGQVSAGSSTISSLSVSSNLGVGGGAYIGGSLITSTGAIQIGTTVAAGSSVPLLTIGKGLGSPSVYPFSVDQNGDIAAASLAAGGAISGGTVSGAAVTATSSLTSTGTLTVSGSGATTLGGALDVTGLSTLGSLVVTGGNSKMDSGGNAIFAGSVTASSFIGTIALGGGAGSATLTGVVPIANGGTAANSSAGALTNLFGTAGTVTVVPGADIISGSVTTTQLSPTGVVAGTYSAVTVGTDGRVLVGYGSGGLVSTLSDGSGDTVAVGTSTGIVFTVNSNEIGNWTNTGLMIGSTTSPAVNKLDVSGGVAIGTTYAGSSVAPTSGLLVQGNVGIGSTAPRGALDVNGTVYGNIFYGSGAGLSGISVSSLTGTLPTSTGGTGTNTTFTQGSVVYAGASGVYSQDNSYFYYDSSSHRLGLGTTTPVASLTVNGTTAFTLGSDYTSTGTINAASFGNASTVRFSGGSDTIFNGITAGVNGQIVYLHNAASSAILTLANLSNSAATGNKITTGTDGDMDVWPGSSVILQYDTVSQLWRVIGGSGGAGEGQAGQVAYYEQTGSEVVGTSTMYIVNDQVGLGTATIANKLDVNGAASIGYVNTTAPASGLLISGNVGIGSTSPRSKLDVNGSIYGTSFFGNGAGLTGVVSSGVSGGTTNYVPLWTSATTLGTSVMYQSSSNVGIGSTSPQSALDVNGTIDIFGKQVLAVPNNDSTSLAAGYLAGMSQSTSPAYNTGLGYRSLNAVGIGSQNAAVGGFAGYLMTDGTRNTLMGYQAGSRITTGSQTTAIGAFAGIYMVAPGNTGNTAIGYTALQGNSDAVSSTGTNNTAVGNSSQANVTSGNSNTSLGVSSLQQNTSGSNSTAIGYAAQRYMVATGSAYNTAVGYQAMYGNTDAVSSVGTNNTSMGYRGLYSITSGSKNAAFGYQALNDLTTGSSNTALGYNTGLGITTGSSNTIIGANVTGLSATLANNIIIADGAGNQRINVNSSGNTGIGTTSPSRKLVVSDTNTQLLITDSNAVSDTTTTNGFLFSVYDGVLGIRGSDSTTNTTAERLNLNASSGNFGIGTNAPANKLDVNGSASIGYVNTAAPSSGMIVSGNVGIGSSSPRAALDVTGTIYGTLFNGSGASLTNIGTSNMTGVTGTADSTTFLRGDNVWSSAITATGVTGGTTNYVPLWTSATTLGTSAVYQSSNNVGVGTTSPNAALDVGGAINLYGYNGLSQPASDSTSIAVGKQALTAQNTVTLFNVGVGYQAGGTTTTGSLNTFMGYRAGFSNLTGSRSTLIGSRAGQYLVPSGIGANTAVGYGSMSGNNDGVSSTGTNNTAMGYFSLSAITSGTSNTAAGYFSLSGATTGVGNTATGYNSLNNLTTASYNTSMGWNSLLNNISGDQDTAFGANAQRYMVATGLTNNTAIGFNAMQGNNDGVSSVGITNTALGAYGLYLLTSGSNNSSVGYRALSDLTTGTGNTALGYNTGRGITTGSSNTIIGAGVTGLSASLSNTIIIADGTGNQRIYVDSSGNTGIGTTSNGTNAKLAVSGGMTLGSYGGNATAAPSNGLIVSGNVGIGSSSPRAALDVTGTIYGTLFSGSGASLTSIGTSNMTGVTGTANSTTVLRGDNTWGTVTANSISGGTTNYLPIWTSTTTLGTSTFYQSGGYAGIGTASPNAVLDINGTLMARSEIQVGNAAGSILGRIGTGSYTGNTSILAFGSDNGSTATAVGFYPAGNQAMVMTSAGVGISTSSPNAALDVNGASMFRGEMQIANSSGTTIYSRIGEGSFTGDNTLLGIGNGSTAVAIGFFPASGAEMMRITATGVGIGSTVPRSALDVTGTIYGTTFSGSGASLTSIGTSNMTGVTGTANSTTFLRGDNVWSSAITATGVTGGTTNYVPLWTSATTLGTSAIYQSSSKIGIGTTSPTGPLDITNGTGDIYANSASTGGKYVNWNINSDVQNDSRANLYFNHSGTQKAAIYTVYLTATNEISALILRTLTSAPITFNPNSTEAMRITATGTVGIGTTTAANKLDVNGSASVGYVNTTAPTNGLLVSGNVGIGSTSPQGALDLGSGQLFLANGSAATPSISFGTNDGTGLYRNGNSVGITAGGTLRFQIGASFQTNNAAGPQISNASGASTTVPVFIPDHADATTGFAAGVLGNLNAIVGGVETMRWTASGVGIGTATIANKLDVNGAASIGYVNTAAPTNGLLVSGNVGIGTATPYQQLDVIGTLRATTFSGSGASLTNIGTSNMTGVTGTADSTTVLRGDNTWGTVTASTISGGTTNYLPLWTSATTLGTSNLYQSSNNIGIGTTTVANSLDVNGAVSIGYQNKTAPTNGLLVSGNVGIGTSTAAAALHIGGSISSPSWTTNGIGLRVARATYTDTTGSGSISNTYVNVFDTPTLAASSSTTFTNAFTLYIPTAPTTGTNASITRAYALGVGGNAVFGGLTAFGGVASPSSVVSIQSPSGGQSSTSWTTTGLLFSVGPWPLFDTSGSGTIATRVANSFAVPTFAATGTETITNAANVYIAGAPIGSSTVTLTNPWALYIAGDNTYFGGSVGISSSTPRAGLDVNGTIYGTTFSGSGASLTNVGTSNMTSVTGTANSTTFLRGDNTWGVVTAAGVSGGTTNYVPLWTSATTLGTSLIYQSSGSVGIGVASPSGALNVDATSGNILNLTNNGSTKFSVTSLGLATTYGLSVSSGQNISFAGYGGINPLSGGVGLLDSSSTQVLVAVNGNVGIGTTSPTTSLSVYNGNSSSTLTNFTQALTNAGINIMTGYTSGNYTPGIFWSTANNNPTLPKAGIWMQEGATGSTLNFGTSNAYATGVTNQAMVIDPSGNVGIGTTTVANKLDVNGAASIGYVNTSAPSSGLIVSGNVGIGTTTPYQQLDVIGTLRATTFSGSGASLTNIGTSNMTGVTGTADGTTFLRGDNVWSSAVTATGITGGTTNYVPLWTSATTLGTSVLYQSSSNVGVGTTSPASPLDVGGKISIYGYNAISQPGGDAYSIAVGRNALNAQNAAATITGNTAVGGYAGASITVGSHNTAIGYYAGYSNTTGNYSTMVGDQAGKYLVATGATTANAAFGYAAMYGQSDGVSSTGIGNTGIGYGGLGRIGSGNYNTALGGYAGYNTTSGATNVFVGYDAGINNVSGSIITLVGAYAGQYLVGTGNTNNTGIGYGALYGNNDGVSSTGTGNTAVGYNSQNAITSGSNNTSIGVQALQNNTAGGRSTALGYQAQRYVVATGNALNTAVGFLSMYGNTDGVSSIGSNNTAIGASALYPITSGNYNTATGQSAGSNTTSGNDNTFTGYEAGLSNVTGSYITLIGDRAGEFMVGTGNIYNTGIGGSALIGNVDGVSSVGTFNTAVGYGSLSSFTSGSKNAGFGYQALSDLTTGTLNTALGYNTGRGITTGSSNTIIGAGVTGLSASLSNTIIIADGAGNQRIYVDSSGNTGIGSTSPRSKLDVVGTIYGTTFNGSGASLTNIGTSNMTGVTGTADSTTVLRGDNTWGTVTASTISGGTTNYVPLWTSATTLGTSALYQSSSKIGIGTTSPISPLQVYETADNTPTIIAARNATQYLSLETGAGGDVLKGYSGTNTSKPMVFNSTTDSSDTAPTGTNSLGFLFQTRTSTKMVMDNAGNFGIGTTAPANKLDVNGAASIGYVNTAAPSSGLIVSGNVGIGTATPYQQLDVIGTLRATTFSGSGASLTSIGTSNMTGVTGTADSTTVLRGDNTWGNVTASNVSGGTTNYLPLWTSATTLGISTIYQSSGYIGIGTSTPVVNLHVHEPSAAATIIKMTNTTSGPLVSDGASLAMLGSDAQFWLYENGYLRFATNNLERMRINSSGNIGIGTNAPANLLDINGAASIGYVNTAAPSNGLLVSGNVGIGTTSPSFPLDVRASDTNTSFLTVNNATINLTNSNTTNNNYAGLYLGQINSAGSRVSTVRLVGVQTAHSNNNEAADFAVLTTSSGTSSEKFRITGAGLVGIGTTTMANKLDVNGAASIGYVNTTAPTSGLLVSGNVGIGTATPYQQLDVIGTLRATLFNGSGASLTSIGTSNMTGVTGTADSTTVLRGDNTWGNVTASNVSGGTTNYVPLWSSATTLGTSALYQSSSNVGIGTTNPLSNLEVQGTGGSHGIRVSDSSSAGLVYSRLESNSLWLYRAGSTSYIRQAGIGSKLQILTSNSSSNDTTAMTFLPSGNVGIGTATPYQQLDVIGTLRATTFSGSGASLTSIGTSNMTGVTGTANSTTFLRGDNVWSSAITATGVTGGTTNYLPLWTSATTLGTSTLYQSSSNIGIGTTTVPNTLEIGAGALGTFTGNRVAISNTSANSGIDMGQGTGNRGRLVWVYNATSANAYMMLGVASGTNPLILQDSGGNVGIGTTTVANKIDVNGAASIGYPGTAAPSSGLIVSGNVGIGTPTPDQALTIGGSSTVDFINGSNYSSQYGAIRYAGGHFNFDMGTNGFEVTNPGSSGVVVFHVHGNGGVDIGADYAGVFTTPPTNGAIIEGNVGIGTTSPTTSLSVYNGNSSSTLTNFTQALTNAGINIMTGYTSGNYTPGIFWSTANNNPTLPKAGIWMQEGATGSTLNFGTSNAYATGVTNQAMVIDPSGNVGIGTATVANKFDVNGAASIGYKNTAAPSNGLLVSGNVGLGTASPAAALHAYSISTIYSQPLFRLEQAGSFGLMSDYVASIQTYGNRSSLGSGTQHGLYVQAGWNTDTNNTEIARFSALTGGYVDVPRMVIKSAGNVGIGTTVPGSTLAVNGGAAIGTYAASGTSVTSGNLIVSGSVGIGSSSPRTGLDVVGSIYGTTFVGSGSSLTNIGTSNMTGVTGTADSTTVLRGDNTWGNVTASNVSGGTTNYVPLWSAATTLGTSVMYQSSSKIGIGTTTPQTTLDVGGAISLYGYNGLALPGGDSSSISAGRSALAAQNTVSIQNVGIGNAAGQNITSGGQNVLVGYQAGNKNVTGSRLTMVGYRAGAFLVQSAASSNTGVGYAALFGNNDGVSSTGTSNTGVGAGAINAFTTGSSNSALGVNAANNLTTGSNNTVVGYNALTTQATGDNSTAVGVNAQKYMVATSNANNTSVGLNSMVGNSDGVSSVGTGNTAMGYSALNSITSGVYNVAIGYASANLNTTGSTNVAIGMQAFYTNTIGSNSISIGGYSQRYMVASGTTANVAVGYQSMQGNSDGVSSTGTLDTAVGHGALFTITSGVSNTAIGYQNQFSSTSGSYNSGLGQYSLYEVTTGSNNTALGYNTGRGITTGSSNTIIGAGVAGLSSSLSNNIIIADGAGNRRINVDSSGNTGIGTTTMANKLDVNGAASIGYVNTAAPASGLLVSGNVGIGSSSPRAALDVNGNIYGTAFYGSGANLTGITSLSGGTTNYVPVWSSATTLGTSVMYQSSSSIGIGTTTPATALDVGGVISLYGYNVLTLPNTDSTSLGIGPSALNAQNSSPSYNVAIGNGAGALTTIGSTNILIGYLAGNKNVSGSRSTYVGYVAGRYAVATGATSNTGIGYNALRGNSDGVSTTGTNNTAVGATALNLVESGVNNTALGASSLNVLTTGNNNVGIGYLALASTVTGSSTTAIGYSSQKYMVASGTTGNTAVGNAAMYGNSDGVSSTGTNNTAVGNNTLVAITSGAGNSAYGVQALGGITSGNTNVGVGYLALAVSATGSSSTAVGYSAQKYMATTGTTGNTAVGNAAMYGNSDGVSSVGTNNTGVGYSSLLTITSGVANTAYGMQSLYDLTTGSNNTALGYNTGRGITTGSSNTIIGASVTGLSATLANNIIIADGAGNRRINVDSSGNTGIGTTTMANKLDVNGAASIGYVNTAAPSSGLIVSGNVGIGTATPYQQLDVIGTLRATTFSGSGASLTSIGTSNMTGVTGTANSTTVLRGDNTWGTVTASTISGGTTNYVPVWSSATTLGTSVMYQSSSSIGIGTTSPQALLHIAQNNTASARFESINNGAVNLDLYRGIVNASYRITTTSGIFSIQRSADGYNTLTTPFSISNNGLVGVGTSAALNKLDVNGAAVIGASYAGVSTATSNGLLVQGSTGIGTASPQAPLHVYAASGAELQLQAGTANCTYTAGVSSETVSCSSDIRLKKDIVDTIDTLDWFHSMRIRDFTIKDTGERKTGVIAQEMLVTHPDMVHMGSNGYYTVDEPSPWKIVKALQQLKAMLLDLAEKIEKLFKHDSEQDDRIAKLEAAMKDLKATNEDHAKEIMNLRKEISTLKSDPPAKTKP